MLDATLPTQAAIYAALAAAEELTSILGGTKIYDRVPKPAVDPFVTIGELTGVDWSTAGHDGQEFELTVHTWDRGQSSVRLKQIMAAILACLHDASLSIAGFNCVSVRYVSQSVITDPDGTTFHGVQRFRLVVEQPA